MPLRSRCRLEWFCNTAVRTGGLWPSLLFSNETVESTALQCPAALRQRRHHLKLRAESMYVKFSHSYVHRMDSTWNRGVEMVRNDKRVWHLQLGFIRCARGKRRMEEEFSDGSEGSVRVVWKQPAVWQQKEVRHWIHTADSDSKEFPPNPNQMETLSKAAKYEVSFKTQSEMKTRNCAGGGQSNLCSLTGLHATLMATC